MVLPSDTHCSSVFVEAGQIVSSLICLITMKMKLLVNVDIVMVEMGMQLYYSF